MCLGIPGKVVEIRDDGPLRMARVDFGGVRKEACLAYVPEVRLGDYVIVHVGFAISHLDEEEALRTLEMIRAIDAEGMAQELGAMADEPAARGPAASGPGGPSRPE
ncbi:MAG: HypC/HybG/HupF family hydrogenase formation chaperone [Candidatus Limnocylindrales bacterium]